MSSFVLPKNQRDAANRSFIAPAAAVLALFCGIAPLSAAPPVTQLIPANFNHRADSLGFDWYVAHSGMLNNDNNGCISNGFMLMETNGNQANLGQAMMTPDGSEFVFTGAMQSAPGIQLTRRVKLDVKTGTMRYVDSFKNTTSAAVTSSIMYQMQLGNQAQWLATDKGQVQPQTLGPKDMGLVAVQTQGTPSLLLFLCGASSKIRPSLSNQSNYRFNYTYPLTVPPGKTVSLVHAAAQRNLAGPQDAKALTALFKPFTSGAWLKDLPSDVRRTIVNASPRGGYSGGEMPELLNALEELNITRGASDILLMGEDTRLHGTVQCGPISVETRFGKTQVPVDKIAAIFGGNRRNRPIRLFLRDGQVLAGKIKAADLKFTMNTGLSVKFTIENLDRLVLRESPDDGQPSADTFALIETFDGDRLAVIRDERTQFTAVTPWGTRIVALADVQQIHLPGEGAVGHRLAMKDGSRFFAYLDDSVLSLNTAAFGPQKLSLMELKALKAVDRGTKGDEPRDLAQPHVVLVGENVFIGQIDRAEIHLVAGGESIPVPPTQIRALHNRSAEDEGTPGAPLFQAELWDGDTIGGNLDNLVLSFRSGDQRLEIPVEDIVDVFVPTPTVPEGLRDKIAELIRELGHAEWSHRESASRELAGLGFAAKIQFEDVLKNATDPEVRKRVQKLLDELKD